MTSSILKTTSVANNSWSVASVGGGGRLATVGCMSTLSLGCQAGSGAVTSVAAYGVWAGSEGSAYIKVCLGRVGLCLFKTFL